MSVSAWAALNWKNRAWVGPYITIYCDGRQHIVRGNKTGMIHELVTCRPGCKIRTHPETAGDIGFKDIDPPKSVYQQLRDLANGKKRGKK